MMKITALITLLLVFKTSISQIKIDTVYFSGTKIIASITTLKNNTKYVVTYNNQGLPVSKIHYVNDKLDGLYQSYNYTGDLASDIEYTNGIKNGQWIQYGKGKIITQKAYYKNDTLHGSLIKYMSNGKTQTLETYVNGNKKGAFEYRFNSGLLSAKGTYDTVYYMSAPRRECGIGDKRNHGGLNIKSVLVGLYQTWYESGSKQKEEHYDKGLLNGVQKAWYENGKLKSVLNYKKNNLNGVQIEYHENGNLYRKYTSLSTYDTATKQFKNSYEGRFEEYTDTKNPIKIVHYKNNIPHGTWQTFTNGKPTLICEYSNGLLVNERKTFFTNTVQLNTYCNYKLIKRSTTDTSYIDGESKTYHQNGIVSSVSVYKDGIQIKQTMYNTDNKISSNTQLLGDLAYTYHYFTNGNTEHEYVAFYNPKKDIFNQDYKVTKINFENGKTKQLFYNEYTNTKLTQHYNDSGLVIFNKIHLTEKIGIETDYYNSGTLKSEGLYMNLNTKLNGFEYLEWYENGNPKSIEVTNVYKISWLSNGLFYKAITYKDNNPNYATPMVIDLKETNNLYEILKNTPQKTLDFSQKNGNIKSYYGTNKLKIETSFYEGNLDNKLIFYFYNGSPMAEFKIDKGVLNGSYKLYTEQCKPLLIGNYCNGLECGKRTDFTSNGDTISDVEYYKPLKPNTYNVHYNYKKEFYYQGNYGIQKPHLQNWFNYNANNKQHGLQTNYYANGNLMCSKTMSNGKDIGAIKNYYENGNLKEDYTLDTLGNKQGDYTYYYPNKKIMSTSYYTNNLQHAPYVYYWPNGAKRIEGNYDLGKKIGAWQYYDSLGVNTKTENFENNKK